MTSSQKILKIVQSHPEYPAYSSRVGKEVAQLQEMDSVDKSEPLQKHLLLTHRRIQLGETVPGNKNKLNLGLAYLMGLTTAKPVGDFSLTKRRTYGRAGFPDIDMDFDYLRRAEVYNYIIQKYGEDKVAHIGTVQKLKTKASVRRSVKVLDPTNSMRYDLDGKLIKSEKNFNFALENEIMDTLPKKMRKRGGFVESVDEACRTYKKFGAYMKQYPEVCRVASAIEGTISGFGQHAAGIVCSPIPLAYICPLHRTGKGSERVIATQFTGPDVERLGLIKIDVLGLKTKTAIHWACKSVKESYGIDINWDAISLDDPETLALLRSGRTDGCFQLEEPGMQDALREIGINAFSDLVVTVAMYRPGPIDYIPEFAARKKGTVKVTYAHPSMKSITEKTHGILCFQEQVMKVFMVMSGLTATDGYKFTKGCAKKIPEMIDQYKDMFTRGCLKNGIGESVINKVWHDMEKFGGYAFNLAHSTSYAFESYKTAYLKAHYPTEFIAARLSVETLDRQFDKVNKYMYDAVQYFGFSFDPPDLNESKLHWTVVKEKKIRQPLLLKGVGPKVAAAIVAGQPYKGNDLLYTFTKKVGSSVNSKAMEAMIEIDLWVSLGLKKSQILANFEQIKKDLKKGGPDKDIFG